MSAASWQRMALAAVLGAGVWAGLARAEILTVAAPPAKPSTSPPIPGSQQVAPPGNPLPPQQYLAPPPNLAEVGPAAAAAQNSANQNGANTNPPRHRWCPKFRAFLGLDCYATMNGYACSNWPSECQFFFGSCRDFFGDPCARTPPPSPLPYKNQPNGANGAAGTGSNQGRCGCP
jgi:hypothetical protein